MTRHMRVRLARLETQLLKNSAAEIDLKSYEFKLAMMSIVGFHVGKWTPADSLATAMARALEMTVGKLKNAISPDNYDGPNFWLMTLEKLDSLVAARGGRPITEDGSLVLRGPGEDDDRRNGLEVLDELYEEIPKGMKDRHHLLPYLGDYLY
jgi:hypothetical protein